MSELEQLKNIGWPAALVLVALILGVAYVLGQWIKGLFK